jgi:hypothetical protein
VGERDDRVLRGTRHLATFIAPFLAVAFVVLYGWPRHTDDLFAWPVAPTMTAMVLGSVYLGGTYFFVRSRRAREWHAVKAGFATVSLFAFLLGIATIVHWDRFDHGHVAFWLWAGLYFTAPFLVSAAWLVNRRTERPAGPDELRFGPVARVVIAAIGVSATGWGTFLYLAPTRAIRVWPWTLTPLTSRVMGTVFLLGIVAVGVLVDARWSTARLMVQVGIVMTTAVLVAAARAHDEFDTSKPLTWLLLAGFTSTLLAAVAVYVVMEDRARAGGATRARSS